MTKAISRTISIVLVICSVILCSAWAQTGRTGTTQTTSTNDQFMNRAMEINTAEVELGRLALDKSQNQQVKDYAQMMVTDHGRALDRLRGAESTGATGGTGGAEAQPSVRLSGEHQQLKDRLSKLSGEQFDRQYMDAMVREHRNAISFFEQHGGKQAQGRQKPTPSPDKNDPATISQELMPTLRQHLQMAQDIQKKLQSSRGTTH